MEQVDDLIGQLRQGLTWIGDRWATSAPPPLWVVAVALSIIVALALIRPAWLVARHAVTIVHEMGHVMMAWAWGRRIDGIRLHTDTSGLAITAGKPRGLGVLMTFLAGYTAPALVGLAMVWASFAGYSGIALTLLVVVLVLAFLLVRNIFGLLVAAAALAGSGWVLWVGDAQTVTAVTFIAGLFLTIGGLRSVGDLSKAHSRGEGATSDAGMAARHSLLPAVAWIWVFGVVNLVCVAQAVSVVFYAVLA